MSEILLAESLRTMMSTFGITQLNREQFGRFVQRSRDVEASVLRLTRASELTPAQSEAMRALVELYLDVAQFMRQFAEAGFAKRMLTHSSDAEAMAGAGAERPGA